MGIREDGKCRTLFDKTNNQNLLRLDTLISNSNNVSSSPSIFNSLYTVTGPHLPYPIKFTSIYDQKFTPPLGKRV